MDTNNRFTLVVQECNIMANNMCIKGLPFGEYNTGDALYIRRSNLPVIKLQVSMTSMDGDLMEIYFESCDFPEKIKYAVVTSVEPQAAPAPNRPIENPFLLGLAREYKERFKEPEFLNEFCYSLINAKFLVPVVSKDLGNKALEDKKVSVNIGFHLIQTQKGRKVFPVFTDWGSANKWTSFKETPDRKTLILDFDQITDISSRDSDGISLNAFDIGVIIPLKFIDSIKESDGYKNRDKVKSSKMTSKSGNVQVGIPQDNDQIRLLKEALISASSKDDRIKESYLFLKKDGSDIAFLVVFDLDLAITDEERKEIFGEANKEIAPVLGGRIKVEFAMKAPHFIKLCNAYEPVYKAE